MEEVLMVPPKEMEILVRYNKGELTENALLNNAARMAAKRDLLLKSKPPAGIIKAKVNSLSRELHHLTKRGRRGPTSGLGGILEEGEEADDDALVTGLMEQVIKKLIKATPSKKDIQKEIVKEGKKEIKTPATPKSSSYWEELHKQTDALQKKSDSKKARNRKVENHSLLNDLGQTRQAQVERRLLKKTRWSTNKGSSHEGKDVSNNAIQGWTYKNGFPNWASNFTHPVTST